MDKGILKNLYLSTTLTPHTTLENAFVNYHHPSSTLQNIAEPYIYIYGTSLGHFQIFHTFSSA